MKATVTSLLAGLVVVCLPLAANAADLPDIHAAARAGDLAHVTALLDANPTLVDARTAEAETPLHYAAASEQAAIVHLLLERGAAIDALDIRGRTPLHYAAAASDVKVLRELLSAGADVSAADGQGDTPLHVAARHCRPAAVDALLSAGADVGVENALGQTPLHVLGADARVRDEELLVLLGAIADRMIAAGADPSIIADGFPALQPPAEQEPGGPTRDTWVEYSEIGPTLQGYQTTYPTLCHWYSLGRTYENRTLYAIKISDNVDVEEDEPEFKYIASMHGDEIVGATMCMNLIDYLLVNYGTDPQVTRLVDEVEIWIVPLMNPDGYDRYPRTRVNGQGIDLNRNFPEGSDGEPNTPQGRAIEVQAIMNWSFQHSFVASANFHCGALVVNYPFDDDNLGSVYSPTPDEDLFVYMSEEYSRYNLPMWNGNWYHGITNGAAWYSISGGMQDWNYRYMGCNGVTIEMSNTKQPSASLIPTYWNENRDSMLAYMETCLIGVRGIVTDAETRAPLAATVRVVGRDHDVFTDPDLGNYHRMLMPGTYDLTFSADGYDPITITDVVVESGDATRLDVQLAPAAQVVAPNGGETLVVGVESEVSWTGNAEAQFQVQYSDNYGQTDATFDGFESGTLGPEYTTGGDADWYVTTGVYHSGSHSARAGNINDNQVSWMTREAGGGALSFWYRVSSESGYDFFNFYIDGSRMVHASGNGSWTLYSTTLPAGTHELMWEYIKDYSMDGGSDTVWIDDLSVTADQTAWQDIIALTDPGAMSTPWTPAVVGSDYKVRVRAVYGGTSYGAWDESDATFEVVESQPAPGDLNCDGTVNFDDIDPFVLALSGQAGYEAQYPDCDWLNADCNQDGSVDFDDIDGFVALLAGGGK